MQILPAFVVGLLLLFFFFAAGVTHLPISRSRRPQHHQAIPSPTTPPPRPIQRCRRVPTSLMQRLKVGDRVPARHQLPRSPPPNAAAPAHPLRHALDIRAGNNHARRPDSLARALANREPRRRAKGGGGRLGSPATDSGLHPKTTRRPSKVGNFGWFSGQRAWGAPGPRREAFPASRMTPGET